MENIVNKEQVMQLMDKLYEQSLNGIAKVCPSIDDMAESYLQKNKDVESAAKEMINNQIVKCTTSGFITSLGGIITLPVAIPANLGSVLFVQMRMIACLARMGGYDTESDNVQTFVYACLAGISIDNLLKDAGIKIGTRITKELITRIPGTVFTAINQKVGFRLVTKFGSKGLINLGKAVPLIGGIIGGGFDFAETAIIAKQAYKMFIDGEVMEADVIVEN